MELGITLDTMNPPLKEHLESWRVVRRIHQRQQKLKRASFRFYWLWFPLKKAFFNVENSWRWFGWPWSHPLENSRRSHGDAMAAMSPVLSRSLWSFTTIESAGLGFSKTLVVYTEAPLFQRDEPKISEDWLAGGFKYFLCSPLPGEMIQFH